MSERACGDCAACCMVLGVRELDKPACQRCDHQVAKGCGVYAERPSSCRVYRCAWLDGLGERRDRPDRLGVVLDQAAPSLEIQERAKAGEVEAVVSVEAARSTLHVREVRPGAFNSQRVKSGLSRLHADGFHLRLVPFGGRALPVGRPL